MKTPDERKEFLQKLRIAASEADDLLTSCDATDLLDGLEVARDFMFEAAAVIERLESRLAQVERERDAAVRDLNCFWKCAICKKFTRPVDKCPHYRECGLSYKFWQWRGVCPENTKEDET